MLQKLANKICHNLIKFGVSLYIIFVLLTAIFAYVPVPFSAYMAQEKIGHLVHGDLKYRQQYQWASIDDISPNVQLAVIAAEDQTFPTHWGLDFKAIQKAFAHNEKSNKTHGASTISQQTVKNLYLWHSTSWTRKIFEVPATITMELIWSKKRILEVYLNIAQFGDNIFGVQAASQHYFGKSAKNLTQYEAALLAAVLPNPILLKASQPSNYVMARQHWIIKNMNRLGLNYLKLLSK